MQALCDAVRVAALGTRSKGVLWGTVSVEDESFSNPCNATYFRCR